MLDHLRVDCRVSVFLVLGLALILCGCFLWEGPGLRNGLAGPIAVSVTYETGESLVLEPGGLFAVGYQVAFTRIEVRSQECGNLILDEPEIRSRQSGLEQDELVVWHVTDCEVVPIGREDLARLSQ